MSFGRQASPSLTSYSQNLPADLEKAVDQATTDWKGGRKTERFWNRDAALWTDGDESKWLGWLDIVDSQLAEIAKFKALAADVREDGFSHLLLLGMGGSSVAPEVFSFTYGSQIGSPELLVLDSTDPVQIKNFRSRIDPARTLFCVSSKSGTTLEPNIYMQYFYDETRKVVADRAGHHFIAITDPGSKLEGVAAKLGFRHVYHGVPSIGGGYSALSDFGLIPHAAAGYDTEKLLKRTATMVDACKNRNPAENPGVKLGLLLGTASAKFQRDKVTLICSRSIHDLGAWLEQLLAESTGKQGYGLIPIDREPFALTEDYGSDRVFAYIKFARDNDSAMEEHVSELESAGQPVVRIVMDDLYDLGQVFFHWEVATAVAGSVIGVDAFNQPDVETTKVVTRELTSEFEKTGSLPREEPVVDSDGIKLFTDEANAKAISQGGSTIGAMIRGHLDRIKPGDYFGLLAYIPMFAEHEEKLHRIREQVLRSKHVATVLGFGPRFLHTTGQAYKGGPNSGVFVQITCDEPDDLPVPEAKYTFGFVKAAQARGDFQVLAERKRRAVRIHLGKNVGAELERLTDLISAAVE